MSSTLTPWPGAHCSATVAEWAHPPRLPSFLGSSWIAPSLLETSLPSSGSPLGEQASAVGPLGKIIWTSYASVFSSVTASTVAGVHPTELLQVFVGMNAKAHVFMTIQCPWHQHSQNRGPGNEAGQLTGGVKVHRCREARGPAPPGLNGAQEGPGPGFALPHPHLYRAQALTPAPPRLPHAPSQPELPSPLLPPTLA